MLGRLPKSSAVAVVLAFVLGALPFAHAAERARPSVRIRLDSLQKRTDRCIGECRRRVKQLEQEIAILEAQSVQKQQAARVDDETLVTQRGKVQRNREWTRLIGIAGVLAGAPLVAFASALKMGDDRARLRELDSRLATVRAERTRLEGEIRGHEAHQIKMRRRLESLRGTEPAIVADVARVKAAVGGRSRSLAEARTALGLSRVLLSNLRGQVRLLSSLRDSAARLGVVLDTHLVFLQRELAQAETLVAESTRAYLDLVRIVLTKDPNAAAGRWLHRRVVDQVATLLQEAGLDPSVSGELAKLLLPRAPAAARRFAGAVMAEMHGREAVSFVNPVNILGGDTNCAEVSLALAHRLRGRQVVALPSEPVTLAEVERLAKAAFLPATTATAEAELLLRGDGADALVFGRRPGDPIGHMWNLVNRGGRIEHLDGQIWTRASDAPMPIRALMVLPRGSRWQPPPSELID